MGRLRYDGTSDPIPIDDVTLAHLKVVIATKLRRQESFMMTWRPVTAGDDRRITVWIHPAIPLQFLFTEAEQPPIEARRIEELMRSLNATGELLIEEILDMEDAA
ncbi:DUF7882 family protein [Microbacterium sp. NPDC055903]